MTSFTVCKLTKAPPPSVIIHSLPRAWERMMAARAAHDKEAERAARGEVFDLAMLLAYLMMTPAERAEWHRQGDERDAWEVRTEQGGLCD